MSKAEILIEEIKSFEKSEKTTKDYLELFIKVHKTTRQGSGLTWGGVEFCINEAIKDR